jgi:hypothetical protein
MVTGFPNLTTIDVMFRIIRNRVAAPPLPMNLPSSPPPSPLLVR